MKLLLCMILSFTLYVSTGTISDDTPECITVNMNDFVYESTTSQIERDYSDISIEGLPVDSWTKLQLTDSEYEMICRMVEAEATGGSLSAKVNVANVILNRVVSNDFPNTIEGVLFQKRQFSPIADGRYYSVKVTESSRNAVDIANSTEDTTNGSTFFMVRVYSDISNVTWFDRNLEFVMKDELEHEFYKMR